MSPALDSDKRQLYDSSATATATGRPRFGDGIVCDSSHAYKLPTCPSCDYVMNCSSPEPAQSGGVIGFSSGPLSGSGGAVVVAAVSLWAPVR